MIIQCAFCNEDVECLPSANRKFCSSSCAAKHNNPIHKLKPRGNCKHCNKVLVARYNQYCNNKCQNAYQTQKKIDLWLESGNVYYKNKMVPPYVKRYISERDDNKCVKCGLNEWMGEPLVLECDHIDGDYRNNNVDNLRTLCPNCHSQTGTYKNNNAGKGRSSRLR